MKQSRMWRQSDRALRRRLKIGEPPISCSRCFAACERAVRLGARGDAARREPFRQSPSMDRLQPFGQRRESRSVEGRSACGAHSPRRERPAKFAGAPLRKPIAEDNHANGRMPCRGRVNRRASRRLRRDNNRRCQPYRQGRRTPSFWTMVRPSLRRRGPSFPT